MTVGGKNALTLHVVESLFCVQKASYPSVGGSTECVLHNF